ncbi:MAG: HAD-IA family hydrolase [Cyanobacteria bacterium P01_C01_bin.89]
MAINGQPQVIFLDAVGTLFGVAGSVGEQYGYMARQFGAIVDDSRLNREFFKAWKKASPCVFPGVTGEDLQRCEYRWWKEIALTTFEGAEVRDQLKDFDAFFQDLFEYFATAAPWFVYPETVKTLRTWQGLGIELGIISNFDTRLYHVLKTLELVDFFQGITLSTEVGAAKPSPMVFTAALHRHRCEPAAAMHIGDSYEDDYLGAKGIGMQARWIRRSY